jgi:molybdopterin-guanine dinucleotide biosynthesis protein A
VNREAFERAKRVIPGGVKFARTYVADDARIFTNVNTPEDYALLRAELDLRV